MGTVDELCAQRDLAAVLSHSAGKLYSADALGVDVHHTVDALEPRNAPCVSAPSHRRTQMLVARFSLLLPSACMRL